MARRKRRAEYHGEKMRSNVINNEIDRDWKAERQRDKELRRDPVTMLHQKGSWQAPGKISILKERGPALPMKLDWMNKETMTPLDQQRVTLNRLMANPDQKILMRTAAHAAKDNRLWTPHVFRNEGGNLMSSIAGAGANKFHEFRQIRRNDLDREKHFDILRDRERLNEEFDTRKRENEEQAKAKLSKNQRKRARQKANWKRKKDEKEYTRAEADRAQKRAEAQNRLKVTLAGTAIEEPPEVIESSSEDEDFDDGIETQPEPPKQPEPVVAEKLVEKTETAITDKPKAILEPKPVVKRKPDTKKSPVAANKFKKPKGPTPAQAFLRSLAADVGSSSSDEDFDDLGEGAPEHLAMRTSMLCKVLQDEAIEPTNDNEDMDVSTATDTTQSTKQEEQCDSQSQAPKRPAEPTDTTEVPEKQQKTSDEPIINEVSSQPLEPASSEPAPTPTEPPAPSTKTADATPEPVLIDTPAPEEPVLIEAPTPTVEEPVLVEPPTEEPVLVEKPVEAPVIEEPVIVETPVEEPVLVETPAEPETTLEEAAEEPVESAPVETTPIEEPEKSESEESEAEEAVRIEHSFAELIKMKLITAKSAELLQACEKTPTDYYTMSLEELETTLADAGAAKRTISATLNKRKAWRDE